MLDNDGRTEQKFNEYTQAFRLSEIKKNEDDLSLLNNVYIRLDLVGHRLKRDT